MQFWRAHRDEFKKPPGALHDRLTNGFGPLPVDRGWVVEFHNNADGHHVLRAVREYGVKQIRVLRDRLQKDGSPSNTELAARLKRELTVPPELQAAVAEFVSTDPTLCARLKRR
jgi:plasmid stability protein